MSSPEHLVLWWPRSSWTSLGRVGNQKKVRTFKIYSVSHGALGSPGCSLGPHHTWGLTGQGLPMYDLELGCLGLGTNGRGKPLSMEGWGGLSLHPRTCSDTGRCCPLCTRGSPLMGDVCTTSPLRFRVARIPEQRTSLVASEVKTITEPGPSMGDFRDSPQPGLLPEQRALLESGENHTKWLKPLAENKAEVRSGGGSC